VTVTITPEIAAEYGLDLPDWITVASVKNTVLQMAIQWRSERNRSCAGKSLFACGA
jgi:hypothetical protein